LAKTKKGFTLFLHFSEIFFDVTKKCRQPKRRRGLSFQIIFISDEAFPRGRAAERENLSPYNLLADGIKT
jgi:hypothetical protein